MNFNTYCYAFANISALIFKINLPLNCSINIKWFLKIYDIRILIDILTNNKRRLIENLSCKAVKKSQNCKYVDIHRERFGKIRYQLKG